MGLGFLGQFFEFKCLDILKSNIDLAWKKLNDDLSKATWSLSSPLLASVLKNGFMAFAKDYAKQNAGKMIGAAIHVIAKVTGKNPFAGLMAAYDSLMFMFVGAMAAYNDYLLRLTQELAEAAVNRGNRKLLELQEIRRDFIPLYNVLVRLSLGGDELYDLYVGQLREALRLLYKSERDVELVWNTLQYSGYFLNQRYETAKQDLKDAADLVQPDISPDYYREIHPGNYDEEFDYPSWKTEASRVSGSSSMFSSDKAFGNAVGDSLSLLARSAGVPATPEQFANMKLVSKLTSQLITTGQGYMLKSFDLNTSLAAFPIALSSLSDSFPDFMIKMLKLQFESFLKDMGEVRKSMASHLNGSERNVFGPEGGFKPKIPVLSTMSLAWTVQLRLIDGYFESIPVSALSANNLNLAAVNEYKRVVAKLKTYNNVTADGEVILGMTAGVETLTDFEQQMLLFLTSATMAMYTFSIDDEILAVGRRLLQRCDINIRRTQEIIDLMKGWRDYELPGQTILDELHNNIISTADKGGFDKFKQALESGNFTSLLTLDGTNASTIGAALLVISFLSKCFAEEGKPTEELDDARDVLTQDLSLFNFSFDLDLSFNIFQGLADCVKFRGFGKKLDLEALLCKLIKDLVADKKDAASSQWDKLGDSLGNIGSSIGSSLGFGGAAASDPGSGST